MKKLLGLIAVCSLATSTAYAGFDLKKVAEINKLRKEGKPINDFWTDSDQFQVISVYLSGDYGYRVDLKLKICFAQVRAGATATESISPVVIDCSKLKKISKEFDALIDW